MKLALAWERTRLACAAREPRALPGRVMKLTEVKS
jgi:hypothetical protein